MEFILESISRTTSACTGWIAALSHEIANDSMENHVVVKAFTS
jgi:hypothetical protein